MSRLRVALVGFGPWGRNIFSAVQKSVPELHLLAVCTRQPLSAEDARALADVGVEHSIDWLSMADSERMEGMLVAAGGRANGQMLEHCLRRGLDCFVEKPAIIDPRQQERVLHEWTRHMLRPAVLVDYVHLFHPLWTVLRKNCPAASIAKVVTKSGGPGPFREESALWDWGSHDVAMAADVLGLADWWGVRPQHYRGLSAAEKREACTRGGQCGSAWTFDLEVARPNEEVGRAVRVSVSNLDAAKHRSFEVRLRDGQVWKYDGEHLFSGSPQTIEMIEMIGPGPSLQPLTRALKSFAQKALGQPLDEPSHARLFGLDLPDLVTRVLADVERRVERRA